jgi:hypothetical protein
MSLSAEAGLATGLSSLCSTSSDHAPGRSVCPQGRGRHGRRQRAPPHEEPVPHRGTGSRRRRAATRGREVPVRLLCGVSSNQGRASPTRCKPKSADRRSESRPNATAIGAYVHQPVQDHAPLTLSLLTIGTMEPRSPRCTQPSTDFAPQLPRNASQDGLRRLCINTRRRSLGLGLRPLEPATILSTNHAVSGCNRLCGSPGWSQ